MPKFRLPFYRDLSARPGMDVMILYGQSNLPNVAAEGIRAEFRKVKRLPGGLIWDGAHLARLKPGAFDAISMAWNTRWLSLIPGMTRARRCGMGVVVWGHGYSKREGPLRAWARRRVTRLADAICFYTHAVRRQYIEAGMPPQMGFVAQNAIDQGPVQAARAACLADPAALDEFKRRHGLSEGPVLLFVSRLYPENRVDRLLGVAGSLSKRYPGLRVVIIGDGPDRARLETMAGELGVAERTIFTGAIYEEERLAPWFCASTLFCYPHNIGLSILHAMGYGLPVVTSDDIAGQNPEIEALRDGENGLLYQEGSIEALGAAIAKICDDPGLRGRMSEEARRTATQVYTIKAMADGMEAALRYAAERARQRRRPAV